MHDASAGGGAQTPPATLITGKIASMPLKITYAGTLDSLKAELQHNDITGTWTEEPNGVHRLRLRNGAALHWSSTKGTLWCDGPTTERRALEGQVGFALHWSSFDEDCD